MRMFVGRAIEECSIVIKLKMLLAVFRLIVMSYYILRSTPAADGLIERKREEVKLDVHSILATL